MRARKHFAHHAGRRAGVHEVVDDQHLAAVLRKIEDLLGHRLQHLDAALVLVVVALDRDALDRADVQFPRHDGRRDQPAAGDGDAPPRTGPSALSRQASARLSRWNWSQLTGKLSGSSGSSVWLLPRRVFSRDFDVGRQAGLLVQFRNHAA
jgi:hypothetical protein